ncbi:MAG: UDP-N-acetylmuramoyl-tripeptide--D-alanyl-D-alanine ligase [Clostridia bacterium]|nr:UDP-N-acetylmuramoyl-tripeptide--D-alanyl-D-alanine ligase [Clostridia bacterium]
MLLYLSTYIFISIVLAGLLLTGRLRHFTHILQLNSYYNSRYAKYFQTHLSEVFSLKMLIPLAAYSFAFWRESLVPAFIGYALLFLVLDMLSPKQREKKPFVFTPRAKRLLFTQGAILALLFFVCFFAGNLTLVGFLVIELLCPLIVSLANAVNAPKEKRVNAAFTDKAKTKIGKCKDLKVIGITGSFGKTSMKNFITQILSLRFDTLMTPGSFNTTMGVVRTINEKLSPLTDVFVCEMGAKNIGDVREICDIVHPDIAVITAIGEMHLDTFKSVDNVVKAKFELADAVEKEGTVFLNYDNEYIRSRSVTGKTVTYGVFPGCDFRAVNIRQTQTGSEFEIEHAGVKSPFKSKLLGLHNVQNLTGAIAVAAHLGLEMKEIALAVRRIEAIEHRLQIKGAAGITLIDDAYNSNPEGAKYALEVLKNFDGYRIVITPGMVELGERSYELNRALGRTAAQCADYIIVVGEINLRAIADGAREANVDERRFYAAKDISDALNQMRAINAEKKVVLLENDLPDNYL